MKVFKILLVIFVANSFSTNLYSQFIAVDDNRSAINLVENVLINSPCANVTNVSVSGGQLGINDNSFGYFNRNSSVFPFNYGVILSTGKATSAIGPNDSILSDGENNWSGDSNLETALGISGSTNATVLEFDFEPLTSKISFEYIFSSEQYLSNPNSNQCGYTDGFAFLLKEVGTTTYKNIALVPGTTTAVSVNTVRGSGTICPAINEQYFSGFNGVNHPTNFNGQTIPLKAEATVIPSKKYHIKLVIADQGNFRYDSAIFLAGGSFKVGIDLGINRITFDKNPLCVGENKTLDATLVGATGYKWFKNNVQIIGENNATYLITDNSNLSEVVYSVEVTLGTTTCVAIGDIKVQFTQKPILKNASLTQCDDDADGKSIFDLTKLNDFIKSDTNNTPLLATQNLVEYFEDPNATIPITNSTTYQNNIANSQTVYAKVQNNFGCSSIATVNLSVSNIIIQDQIVDFCDDDSSQDGFTQISLDTELTSELITRNLFPTNSGLVIGYYNSKKDAILQKNLISNLFSNSTSNQQILFARVFNGSDCYGVFKITLNILSFIGNIFQDETKYICPNKNLKLEVPIGYSYIWNNGNTVDNFINVLSTGTYTVKVTKANCSITKTFNVLDSDLAKIISVDVNDFNENGNTILVNYSGNGSYEFSINGIDFQDNPKFDNVEIGEYYITIRDRNKCDDVISDKIYVLDFPKFFSPNNDGINDFWKINNLNKAATVAIYDRFGKLMKQFSATDNGWDGNLYGNQLPADDYWFIINIDNKRTIKNHFALKR